MEKKKSNDRDGKIRREICPKCVISIQFSFLKTNFWLFDQSFSLSFTEQNRYFLSRRLISSFFIFVPLFFPCKQYLYLTLSFNFFLPSSRLYSPFSTPSIRFYPSFSALPKPRENPSYFC